MSPELRFVALACVPPRDAERHARVAGAAADVAGWAEVRRLAAAHRVEGLVAHAVLRAEPGFGEAVAAPFRQVADRVKARALEDLAETLRIARAMESRGIGYRILKGVPLGMRAYGTPALKQSWDVDLLVRPEEAVRAASILAGLGYEPHLPPRPLDAAEFRRWSAVSKEAELCSAGGRTVELHWGLADHPMLLAGLDASGAAMRVELLGSAWVATLEDEATLAYLAVHGAFHGWSRLKWLADFSAFLGQRPPDGQRALVEGARRWSTGRALDQALTLSNRLLETEFEGAEDPAAARLADLAGIVIDRRGRVADADSDPTAVRAIRAAQRMLVDSRAYRARLAFQALRGTEDRRHVPLPRALGWLYWLIRPFGATWRSARRRLQKSGHLPLH